MALIPCKECGKEISDQAPSCPGCGIEFVVPDRTAPYEDDWDVSQIYQGSTPKSWRVEDQFGLPTGQRIVKGKANAT